nr:hypothetical protein [Tanacetum cinerariifolium]
MKELVLDQGFITAARRTRKNNANNTNPPNKTTDEVARQLHTAFLNLLTQLVQALEEVGIRISEPQDGWVIHRWGLDLEIKAHATSSKPGTIQGAVSLANRLTIDGIKDGIFKKKENAGTKKRSND